MIIQRKSVSRKWLLFIFVTGLSVPVYSKMDNWLWKVDKTEFSASEFSNDYKIYIDLMAWQMGTTAPVLEEYLNKSSQLADPKTRGIIEQMKPEPFAENFLVLSLLKKHAMEHKYFDQPSTKIKKEFISDYIMIQLYLNDVIQKLPVDIKNEDAEKEWLSERENNENLKSIPIEQGITLMKQKMTQDRREVLRKEFIKSLFERYKVEKNPDYGKIISGLKINQD